ncbi:MAG: LCP family protein [Hyphomicrobiales bacterium]
MAVEEVRMRARPRSIAAPAARPAPQSLTVGQRWLFVLALFTFGLASAYTGIVTLNRVWPALFPGKTLPIVSAIQDLGVPTSNLGIKPSGAESSFNKRINLLIIGLDRRPQEQDEDAYRADTIMITTVDPLTKQASALSLPRDLYIDIHAPGGTYKGRINESYVAGYQNGDSHKAGALQLEKDIKENFGIEIDHYVVLDFKGVETLIDAIGGIDIDIPTEPYDLSVPQWYYSDDDLNATWVEFPPGEWHLDGYHAVAFGRYRNDSDLMRVKRQQLVLQTALAKVFSQGLLNDPIGLWNSYKDTVKTDIPFANLPGYALLLKETNGTLKTYSVGDPVNGVQTVENIMTDEGASVLEWNPENVQYWISQAFTPAKYAASSVEIQNGYGPDGEVRVLGLGRYLKYVQGLPTVEAGGDAEVQPTTTLVLYDKNKQALADDIADWLDLAPDAVTVAEKTSETQPDIVIVIGQDFRIPD